MSEKFEANRKPADTDKLMAGGVEFTFLAIQSVVESFYKQVAMDPLLRVPFQSVQDWPHHIDRLTHFWWTRFGGSAYLDASYDPVGKHFEAGFNQEFLVRWLELFRKTTNKVLQPQQAHVWSSLADRMGAALSHKNELYKAHMEANPGSER